MIAMTYQTTFPINTRMNKSVDSFKCISSFVCNIVFQSTK